MRSLVFGNFAHQFCDRDRSIYLLSWDEKFCILTVTAKWTKLLCWLCPIHQFKFVVRFHCRIKRALIVGSVVITEETSFISRGYPYSTATLYVYCDNCGSFNIKKYLNFRKWLSVIASCAMVGSIVFVFSSGPIYNVGYYFLGVIIFFVAIKYLWGNASFKCRKCGKATTARYNTLDYSSHDMNILDVPERLTQKRYLEYWPDQLDIDNWLTKSD